MARVTSGGGGGGSSDPTPLQLIDKARETGNLGNIIVYGFGGAIYAAWISGINLIQAILNVLILPLEALGINAAGIVDSFVGGIADIIRTGAVTAQQTILPGQPWAIGPFTFGLSVVAAGVGLYVMAKILELAPTSDLLPGTFTNVPLLGTEEEESDQ